jgi:hypothetical protein
MFNIIKNKDTIFVTETLYNKKGVNSKMVTVRKMRKNIYDYDDFQPTKRIHKILKTKEDDKVSVDRVGDQYCFNWWVDEGKRSAQIKHKCIHKTNLTSHDLKTIRQYFNSLP